MTKRVNTRGSTERVKQFEEFADLTAQAAKGKMDVRFENHHLVRCWEKKNCVQTSCPSFHSENLRCWQVAGTFCRGEVQGVFAKKLGDCMKCEVFQESCLRDPMTATGENFNNMMLLFEHTIFLLVSRSREVTALNSLFRKLLDEKMGADEAYRHLRGAISDVVAVALKETGADQPQEESPATPGNETACLAKR